MSPPHIPQYKMIVALCRGGGIGYQGTLPWPKIERDLRFFSEMTRSSTFPYNSAVVMGRKTWESIPATAQPLPFRDNFVVSALHDHDHDHDHDHGATEHTTGVTFIKNLSEMHTYAANYEVVWFIGGASIYEQVLTSSSSSSSSSPLFPVDDIYITFVDESYEHDTAFPLMYQYESIEEWQSLQNDRVNRAIWCWTDTESIPTYVSFFNSPSIHNTVYRVMDVDRDIVAGITRPADIRAIQERRTPNTLFLRLGRLMDV